MYFYWIVLISPTFQTKAVSWHMNVEHEINFSFYFNDKYTN